MNNVNVNNENIDKNFIQLYKKLKVLIFNFLILNDN